MIEAIIFDLDNTLIDFMRMKKASCEEAIDAMINAGLDMDKKKALKLLFELYEDYGIEYKEIFQKFLKKTIGHIDWKILSAGIVAYRRIKMGYLSPYPGVHSTLLKLKLKGIKLAILSDAPRMRGWTRLASTNLADFFDVVMTFDDTKKLKPNPRPFQLMIKKLNVKPENVLMVGDNPERDIVGATKFKMKTCFAKYGAVKVYKNSGADYEIRKITDLLGIVQKENNISLGR